MKGSKVKEAEFLLQLEALCTQYNDVYWKLLDGGVWTTQGEGPTIEADLLRAEDYMGFFEYCEILIKNGAIRERLLMLMFGYKIMCLARNKVLMAATVESPVYGPYWELFASIAARANKNSLFRSH